MFCVPGEEEGNFKLLCHFFADQVQVLRQEISSAKAIVRRLENLPQPNQVCSMQSYEIKSHPWTILWLRILGIFSVENIKRLCVFKAS